jgi:very-short-patch-repair endonuclease
VTNLASERARRMRQEKGPAERRLWYKLREFNRHGFQFRQQAPIGPYIADFCDHSAKLVIEVDGAQHGEQKGLAADKRRTRWLESQGYRVLRFWNQEVLTNIGGVEIAIKVAVGLLSEDGRSEVSDLQLASSAMERLQKKARRLVRKYGRRQSDGVPSPLVGVVRGGAEPPTSAVGIPPTPSPSPRGGGESARRSRQGTERYSG